MCLKHSHLSLEKQYRSPVADFVRGQEPLAGGGASLVLPAPWPSRGGGDSELGASLSAVEGTANHSQRSCLKRKRPIGAGASSLAEAPARPCTSHHTAHALGTVCAFFKDKKIQRRKVRGM